MLAYNSLSIDLGQNLNNGALKDTMDKLPAHTPKRWGDGQPFRYAISPQRKDRVLSLEAIFKGKKKPLCWGCYLIWFECNGLDNSPSIGAII
jgi:hypothetical protein